MLTQIQTLAVNAIVKAIETGNRLIVSSTAGSGKTYVVEQTSFAIERLQHMSSLRIAALAYNTNAAEELKERCTNAVDATTFHSRGIRILGSHYGNIDKQDSLHFLYARYILGYNETRDKTEQKHINKLANRADTLAQYAKETMSDDYSDLIVRFNIKTEWGSEDHTGTIIQTANDIVCTTVQRFERSGKLTYTDMLYLPVVLNLVDRYDVVIVDEAQDINPVKWAMIETCLKPSTLVLVGDNNQAINLWNGAIPKLLADLEYKTVRLNKTHRNGHNGCAYVRQRFDVDHFPADNVKTDDVVTNVDNLEQLTDAMSSGLILSRTNADLIPAWHKLVQLGFTATIVGDDSLAPSLFVALKSNSLDKLLNDGSVNEDVYNTAKYVLEAVNGNREEALDFVSKMTGMPICKKCGRGMSLKSGKWNKFYGCNGYNDSPKCKNTITESKFEMLVPQYTLSTVHKQKGSTWSNVAQLPNLDGLGETDEEFNVRFVASTRQTHGLFLVGHVVQ